MHKYSSPIPHLILAYIIHHNNNGSYKFLYTSHHHVKANTYFFPAVLLPLIHISDIMLRRFSFYSSLILYFQRCFRISLTMNYLLKLLRALLSLSFFSFFLCDMIFCSSLSLSLVGSLSICTYAWLIHHNKKVL